MSQALTQPAPLRLRAADTHDLLVLGSCIQDSLVPVVGMDFNLADHAFTLLLNRFMWEADPEESSDTPHYYRTHSGLRFSHVQKVHYQNMDFKNATLTLNLLALKREADGIHLLFSQGAALRLDITQIEAHLFDLEDPWLTPSLPDHFLKEKIQESVHP